MPVTNKDNSENTVHRDHELYGKKMDLNSISFGAKNKWIFAL